jgi:hypothetical protein
MGMPGALAALLALIAVVAPPAVGSEVRVKLKSGQVRDGVVLRQLEKGFLLKTDTTTEAIALDQAASIDTFKKTAGEVSIETFDGVTVTGPGVETSTGYIVDTPRGKVTVPYERIKSMRGGNLEAPPDAALTAPASAAPPGVERAATPPPSSRPFRFGFGVTGIVLPINDVTWALGLEGTLAFALGDRWAIRVMLNFTHHEDRFQGSNLLFGEATLDLWFGVYGVNALAGLGAALFNAKDGGWDGLGAMVISGVSPVRLRFGERVHSELGLEVDVLLFPGYGVRPFGRVGYTLLF